LFRDAGIPDEENDALTRLNDESLRADLAKMKSQLLDTYRSLAQNFPPAPRLESDEAERVRHAVEKDLAAGVSLTGRDLREPLSVGPTSREPICALRSLKTPISRTRGSNARTSAVPC